MCCNWINYLIFPLFRFSFSPWITRTQDFSWVVSWLCCLLPSYFLLLLLHLFLPCFPSPSVLCVPWRRPKTASTVELYYNQDLTCYYQNDSRFTCTMATVDSKGLPHDAPSVTLTIRLLMAGKVLSINFLAFALFFFFIFSILSFSLALTWCFWCIMYSCIFSLWLQTCGSFMAFLFLSVLDLDKR